MAILIDEAVSVPDVLRDIDPFDIVLGDSVVRGRNGSNQHISLMAVGIEQAGQFRLVFVPSVLIQCWVLRHHIGQGKGGITTWN